MNLAVSLANAATDFIETQIEDIADEYSEFLVDKEAKLELIEAKREEWGLDVEYLLEPSFLLYRNTRRTSDMTEPDLYYTKKIHTGNIGTLALDIIPNYVDLSLALPKFNSFA